MTEDPMTVRDRAMFELFYSSGLRLSELTGATLDNLDLEQQTVRVTGKGNKTRVVPVGSFAVDALREWLPQRAALAPAACRRVFVNRTGRPVSPRTVQHRLKQWALKQGLSPSGSSAYAAAFVRVASAAVERRPARGAGDARPCEHLDDTGVYASGFPVPREGLRRCASAGKAQDISRRDAESQRKAKAKQD